jgi:transcriptional regulator with XRE-family HTH domain
MDQFVNDQLDRYAGLDMQNREDPHSLTDTVRKLRLALNLTQQELAERLGFGIATIVRYEKNRAPDARALGRLEQLASEHGFDAFASIFRRALAAKLTTPVPPREVRGPFNNEDERSLGMALLKVLRQECFAKQAKTIRRVLAPIIEDDQRRQEFDDATEAQRRAIVTFLNAGASAKEVMAQFRTTELGVADALFMNGSSVLVKQRMPEIFILLRSKGWSIAKMAEEFGNGDANPFLICAAEMRDLIALREYEESTAGAKDG